MEKIFVPIKDNKLLNKKFLLYHVNINKSRSPNWNFVVDYVDEIIDEKLKSIEEFIKNNYSEKAAKEILLKSLNKISKSSKDDYINELYEGAESIFLGVFLTVTLQIRELKFKKDWKIVCITGSLRYNYIDKTLDLVSIDDVQSKFEDEFLIEAGKTDEECLFLYISDEKEEKIPHGENIEKNGNITVQHFSPKEHHTIKDILNYLFDYDARQYKLLDNMENYDDYGFDYVYDKRFDEFLEKIINDSGWRGLFVHAVGGSGKSAFAMEIVRRLFKEKYIYAPLWVRVDADFEKQIENDTRGNRNNTEKYLISKFASQLFDMNYVEEEFNYDNKQRIISELTKEDYLIVIDNIELNGSAVEYLLSVIKEIFPDRNSRPFLIITSRNICSKLDFVKDLRLKTIEPFLLKKTGVRKLVKIIIEVFSKHNDLYLWKITRAKEVGKLTVLMDIIVKKYGHNPHLIVTALSLLKGNVDIGELSVLIEKEHDRYKTTMLGEEIKIYEKAFSFLNESQVKILYLFLLFGKENPVSRIVIGEKIRMSNQFECTPLDHEIDEALDTLSDLFLIKYKNYNDKPSYIIESIPYRIFLFESEFLHFDHKNKDYMRDKIVPIELQLKQALEYDLDIDIINSMLERMMNNNVDIDKKITFSIWIYSSGTLLKKCNLFHVAARYGNMAVLDWLFRKEPRFINKKNKDGWTVFHFAASNTDPFVLDFLYKKAPKLLKERTYGEWTVFHCAAEKSSVAVLEWLYKRIPEQLEMKTHHQEFGWTVYHSAIYNNNLTVLKWLYRKAPKLLTEDTYGGYTVFHMAAEQGSAAILKWLYNKEPELIMKRTKMFDFTIFHCAIMYNKAYILEWLYQRAPILLKKRISFFDYTVFHFAVSHGNIAILNWLYEKVPGLLKYKTKLSGDTVYHYIYKDIDDNVLDWVHKKTPKLLYVKNDSGKTIYDIAKKENFTNILTWLSKNAPELCISDEE